jgi:hypothetical protein
MSCCALMLLFIAMCYRTVASRWFSCVVVGVVVLLLLCVSLVFMDLLCAAALDGLLYSSVVDWLLAPVFWINSCTLVLWIGCCDLD